MKRCLIYDNMGKILLSSTGVVEGSISSVNFTFAEDIGGKFIKSVNPETGEVNYVDKPKTETQILNEKMIQLQLALTEISDQLLS